MNEIAKTILIDQEPEQVGEYLFRITQNYLYQEITNWENFMYDKLYEFYKKHNISRVFIISREDFERFLLWALPKWEKENNERDI